MAPSLLTAGIKRDAGTDPGDLLDEEAQLDRATTGAAVLLGIGHAGEAVLNEQLVDIPRVLVGLVDLRCPGSELVLAQLPHGPAEHLLLLGRLEVQSIAHGPMVSRAGGLNRPLRTVG